MPRTLIGTNLDLFVFGPARGGRFGFRTPPSPPTGIVCGARESVRLADHGIRPYIRPDGRQEAALRANGEWQLPEQWMTSRSSWPDRARVLRAIEHRCAVELTTRHLQGGQKAPEFGQETRPARSNPSKRNLSFDDRERPESRGDNSCSG